MMESRTQFTDVVIIGAGMSGMAAASALTTAGRRVTVVDKGSCVGGRMASRRIGDAVFDHGAQFITVRSEQFAQKIQQWRGQGIVSEWCRGFSAMADGHSRWRGHPDMTALPRVLAEGVEVFQTHGWLFSKPLRVYEAPCALVHSRPALVMAGDAFAGPKVEGAACSGWAAAECLLEQLSLSS